MDFSALTASHMLGELGRFASWLKGDCVQPEEYAGLSVTEKVNHYVSVYCESNEECISKYVNGAVMELGT